MDLDTLHRPLAHSRVGAFLLNTSPGTRFPRHNWRESAARR